MNPWLRKAIAVCEMIGGIVGPVSVLSLMVVAKFRVDVVVMGVIVLSFFLLSLYAGVMLWRDRRSGYTASVFVQLIQLPKLMTTYLFFMMSFGFDFMVMSVVHPNGLHGLIANVRFGQSNDFFINPPPGGPLGFGISLVSCVSLWLLRKGGGIEPLRKGSTSSTDPIEEFKRLQETIKKAKEEAT